MVNEVVFVPLGVLLMIITTVEQTVFYDILQLENLIKDILSENLLKIKINPKTYEPSWSRFNGSDF